MKVGTHDGKILIIRESSITSSTNGDHTTIMAVIDMRLEHTEVVGNIMKPRKNVILKF